jgi:uncharacterized integral membrane protein
MRYVYLLLLIALTGVLFLFKLQNLEATTVQFLSASLALPLAMVYELGVFTGGLLLALVRSRLRGASKLALRLGCRRWWSG